MSANTPAETRELTATERAERQRAVVQALGRVLPQDAILYTPEDTTPYECDGLTAYRERPLVVALPETEAQVQAVLKTCHALQVPVVARGAGTGLSGGAMPHKLGVTLSMARFNQIKTVDPVSRTAVVQCGVRNLAISEAAAPYGLYYAPDPSSQIACTIGGNVAENSGGVHCLKYGVTSNHVLELEVVLPDGTITTLGGQLPEMPGLDLRGVFIGSEGTLGIATAITLRLLRAPETVAVLLADFASMEAAGEAVRRVTGAGVLPAGMEMMDSLCIQAVDDYFGVDEYPRDAAAVLLIELDGHALEVKDSVELASRLCLEAGAGGVRQAWTEEARTRLWKGRKSAITALGRQYPSYYLQDGVVPRTALPGVLAAIEQLSGEHGLPVANVFHAGDGNLHPLILYRAGDPGVNDRVKALGGDILRLCLEAGGSISGEHGVGSDKRCYMDWMFSPDDLACMQLVRRAFDPEGLANPGKIFPTPKSCGESLGRLVELKAQGAELPEDALVF